MTDEQIAQGAKKKLAHCQRRADEDATRDPDGAYVFMTPEQRRANDIRLTLLREICGD